MSNSSEADNHSSKDDNLYRLYAHIGSPYSMKMRALLRYRRIPHIVMGGNGAWQHAMSSVRVPVMPVLEYPEGSYNNDSTPLILDLEKRHTARSVIPEREGDAFLAALIEDLADEWLSKSMYAFRWAFPDHTKWTSQLIAYDMMFGGGVEKLEKFARPFEERQVGRSPLVGCTEANMPMLMHIANTVLDVMEASVTDQPFLFGSRPSNADFALFGQLTQFTLDLAAIEPCSARAPYTMRWTHLVDDLSGHEGAWRDDDDAFPGAVRSLLKFAGEAYLPFLVANAKALEAGAETVEVTVHGLDYQAAPFKYQARCLANLRRAYEGLSTTARAQVDPLLGETGCLDALAD